MGTYQRLMMKRELRDAINRLDVKDSIYLATLLGLNKNKICVMSGVDASNFYKYLKTNKGLSSTKQMLILRTIEEVLLQC